MKKRVQIELRLDVECSDAEVDLLKKVALSTLRDALGEFCSARRTPTAADYVENRYPRHPLGTPGWHDEKIREVEGRLWAALAMKGAEVVVRSTTSSGERDCSEGGVCEYAPDLEYDSTGETINCVKCGEEP